SIYFLFGFTFHLLFSFSIQAIMTSAPLDTSHCEFSALMSIAEAPANTAVHDLLQMTAFADGPAYPHLQDLIVPEETAFSLSYYNESTQSFAVDHAVMLDGILAVENKQNAAPILHVRADWATP